MQNTSNSKRCWKCKEEKPLSEFHVKRANKDGKMSMCKPCACAHVMSYRLRDPEAARAKDRQRYHTNPKRKQAQIKQATQHQKDFPESARKRKRAWEKRNRDYMAQKQSRKRAQTPPWANEFFMREIYHLAKLRRTMTGIDWHVDHIVPLKSNLVCGLHNEFNLAVIPAAVNVRKGNKVWPDMP